MSDPIATTESRPVASASRRFGPVLLIGLAVLVLDQLTKAIVTARIDLHDSVPVIENFVDIVHVRNPGAAFSLLASAPAWFRGPFFIVVTLGAIGALGYVAARLEAEDRVLRLALSGVLGGALGNLIDRLRYGEVIDFISVHWRQYQWPAFNVADSSITVAVTVVVLHSFFWRGAPIDHTRAGPGGAA